MSPRLRARTGLIGLLTVVGGTVAARAVAGGGAPAVLVAAPPVAAPPTPEATAPTPEAATTATAPTPEATTTAPTPAATAPMTAPTAAATSAARSSTSASRTVVGDVEQTRFGPVQVRLTLRGSTIVDVTAVQLPADERRSMEISSYSGPELRQEVLQAQSAQIQGVSGASYTSQGYAASVQSALDRA